MKQYKVGYDTFTVRERKQTMELPFGVVNHMLCALTEAEQFSEKLGLYGMAGSYEKLREEIYNILYENGYYDNLKNE